MDEELLLNGVDGSTGELTSLSSEQVIDIARQHATEEAERELRAIHDPDLHYGTVSDIEPGSLADAGWGLVLPAVADEPAKRRREEILEALKPLIDRRKEHAGDRFKILDWAPNETREAFLGKYRQPIGPIDPRNVPYYQLIVASPSEITFDQQYSLDVPAAVGRLWFDNNDDLHRYATFVAELEAGKRSYPRSRAMRFLGVRNTGDESTTRSSTGLVPPLAADVTVPGWEVESLIGAQTKQPALRDRLGGANTPAILFTASHGVLYKKDHPQQRELQGALVCQEWPNKGFPAREHLFAGEDVKDNADVAGMVAFLFACHSAGTPVDNQFLKVKDPRVPRQLTDNPFVAALPNRLLSHPNGPALAVIGHVERAFAIGFNTDGVKQIAHYSSTLRSIARGHQIGRALENFGARYSDLTTILTRDLARKDAGKEIPDIQLARLWTATHDARNYILLGDPAASIPQPIVDK